MIKHFVSKYLPVSFATANYSFQESLKTIKSLSQRCNGCTNYGITKFSDLTPEEFSKFHLTPITTRIPRTATFSMTRPKRSITEVALPSVDW